MSPDTSSPRFPHTSDLEILKKHGFQVLSEEPVKIRHTVFGEELEGNSAKLLIHALQVLEGQPRTDRPHRYDRLNKAKAAANEVREATYKGEWILPIGVVASDLRCLRNYVNALIAEVEEEQKIAGDPP